MDGVPKFKPAGFAIVPKDKPVVGADDAGVPKLKPVPIGKQKYNSILYKYILRPLDRSRKNL